MTASTNFVVICERCRRSLAPKCQPTLNMLDAACEGLAGYALLFVSLLRAARANLCSCGWSSTFAG